MDFKINISEKLFLKIPTLEDAEEIYNVIDKDREHLREWLAWVDKTTLVKDTEENIHKRIEAFKNKDSASFIAFYENNPIASVGFISIDSENRKGEIGYWLSSHYGGKGIMTECVEAVIDYGFEDLDLNKVVIKCSSKNLKSAGIPQRLEFVHEGTLRDDRCIDGTYHDTLVFGLLRSEWCE